MHNSSDGRPDPDALLKQTKSDGRGRLKIYLGAAPGVGKTYAMLEDGHRRQRDGIDVLAAIVETHGRAETASLLSGLEQLPRQTLEYRGQQLGEMDIDALLARRPQLALIDELAHANVPGSRHPKRWQDVEEVLAAGINVVSTLNIQHIESLNDVVARITGVRVQETLPDAVLQLADEIELVDLPPDELIERLREGKVYVQEQVGRALASFFSKGNLTALRELAMRTAAARVDDELIRHMQANAIKGPWPAQDRLMVCVNEAPNAKGLVRAGKRLADRAKVPWIVATVVTPRHLGLGVWANEARSEVLRLAETLGAETVTLNAETDAVGELLRFARERNVTRLLIGRPRKRGPFGLLREPVSDKLLDAATDFEVTVVAPSTSAARKRVAAAANAIPKARLPYVFALLATAIASAFAWTIAALVPDGSVAVAFLIGVLVIGARFGLWPSVAASLMSFVAYNFFFTEPRFSLQVARPADVLALFLFLAGAIVTGSLAGRLKAQVEAMRVSQKRTATLYDFSRKIAAAGTLDDVLWAAVTHVAATLGGQSAVLMPTATGALEVVAGFPPIDSLDARDEGAARYAWDRQEPAGSGTQTLPAADWLFVPLGTRTARIGVLGLTLHAKGALEPEIKKLLVAVEDQVAVAIERTQLASDLEETRITAEAEKLRAALLNSVSHDLRTPLVSIIGSANGLVDGAERLSPADRAELSETILSEAERLNRYVQNLLDMTRLGYGALSPRATPTDLREIIGRVRLDMRRVLGGRTLDLGIPADLPPLAIDPVLAGQVFTNLIENACKHAQGETPIRIDARRDGEFALIGVADDGPGIPEAERAKVFDLFHRVRAGDGAVTGTGLGLAIAKGLVEAHGGTIRAETGDGGRGARIAFTLPLARDIAAAPESAL
jgi:two-component system sensor histidine kinase KdpD